MKIIIANWKMNLTLKESVALAKKIKSGVQKMKNRPEVVICPSFVSLSNVGKIIKNSKITLGAQDIFWEIKGAFTGEASARALREEGCKYVIIGHSERRQYLKETDKMVNQKVKITLKTNLIPVICVGEKKSQRDKGLRDTVIINQISKALDKIKIRKNQKVIIAYEPVWAIGTGRAVKPKEAEEAHKIIKSVLFKKFSPDLVRNNFRIIYGGSVDSKNAKGFAEQENIDGALVATASLKAKEFLKIIKAFL